MASLLALLSCLMVSLLGCVDGITPSCTSVRTKYQAKGLLQSDVPSKPVSGSGLQVCSPSSNTCCSKRMEDNFAGLANTDFDVALDENTKNLSELFIKHGQLFDVFFKGLLKKSEKDLNSLFVKTYGIFYKNNDKVFIDLFKSLNQYYTGKNLDLTQVMNNFFATLMKEMFQLMNTKYAFEKSYLDCVTEHMDDLKPFGDEKQKLTSQVKRSFVAARTFMQGIDVGISVLKKLKEIPATRECEKEITKLSYCSWCQGRTDIKPCPNFCTDAYQKCFADFQGVSTAWNTYINALLELSTRFEGPFSIENVIDPLGVKISFAIMNYQEDNMNVANKIFAGCGKPKASKTKRSSDSDFFIDEPRKVRREVKQNDPRPTPPTTSTTSLGRMTRVFKEEIKPEKDFWQNIPSNICAAPKSSTDSSNCWNGTAIGKYTSPSSSSNNIDSSLSANKDKIEQQVAVLKAMTQRLTSAFSGEDVNVVGVETDGSGDESGSGSGSGDDNDITPVPSSSPTTDDNLLGDEEDNMLGGGVSDGGNVLGNKNGSNSAKNVKAINALLLTMLLFVYINLKW